MRASWRALRRGLAALAGEVVREPMFLLLLGAGAVYLLMGDQRFPCGPLRGSS